MFGIDLIVQEKQLFVEASPFSIPTRLQLGNM